METRRTGVNWTISITLEFAPETKTHSGLSNIYICIKSTWLWKENQRRQPVRTEHLRTNT